MTSGVHRKLRILLVDDEPLALEGLRDQLCLDPDVDIIGTCEDGDSAVEAIRRLEPDLVFLDVKMPEMDAFGVIRSIGVDNMPVVVFVTAYDEHALRAFEVNAVDYVLKPCDTARLEAALARAKRAVRDRAPGQAEARLSALLGSTGPASASASASWPKRVAIRDGSRVRFVSVTVIDWIEGADYYARLHVGPKSYLLRETMNSLAERLDPGRFFRTHRSAIVSLDRVREIQPSSSGDSVVVLTSGAQVRLARARRGLLAAVLTGDKRVT